MRRVLCALLAACALLGQTAEAERARELLASGHAAEAAAIYSELARAQPDNANLLLNLSIAQYKAGRFADAARSATAALEIDPELIPAHLFLGASCLETGELDKAIDSLERVVKANPDERNARLMLGEALLRAHRPADAIEHLQSAAQMLPTNPRVWYGLGQAYESLGRNEPAADAWKRLSDLPPSRESHMHAAQLNDREHRWSEAVAEWREALRLGSENTAVRVALAWSLYRLRDYQQAMDVLKPLMAGAPTAEVQFLYGASLLNLQQPKEAEPHLREAVARDPKLAPARAALGQALLQTGRPQEAIPLLEQALSADEDGSIHFQVFRAYQLTNRTAEAKQALAGYRRLRASLEESR